MKKRVAITGLGVATPIGSGTEKFWANMREGIVGTGPVSSFDATVYGEYNKGGEIKDLNPSDYMHIINPLETGRTTQLAVAVARMAFEDAKLDVFSYERDRIGVCFGTTMGNNSIVEMYHDLEVKTNDSIKWDVMKFYPENYISAAVSLELGCEGPSLMVPTACAAGNYAISNGMDLIQDGQADAVIVGGSDGMSRACFTTFYCLGAIDPTVVRPFDKNRSGTIVSEGASALVLEDYDKAVARGAKIYAELLGYGLSCDANHPTAPHPDGLGAKLAIRRALDKANINPDEVSYISAHGTGTKANDFTESIAIRDIFGEKADHIPSSSIKSMLGHTMGAASAIEAVACTLAIRDSVVPPTMNYVEPDNNCLVNIVANAAVSADVDIVLSNAFAFGGNISTIIIGKAR
ncbi:beta-ketoacyl-[acyl-carrier-protein] synthase family protein [Paenibacillus sp. ISL-20]|uniref:beta-ketoacyl-[acyl-carrier-protein] synthase family protein n=1 Tax=Paenibacillus sp. ISL-20 TaxID=2819163 RepID=UPI001BEC983B|nr:beta-ketoacyl-[acyl-carrier-protein] synthase family protein [Paenibacillus sp. ISL-20]MBT2762680.1 beta-ketoacyl-[acyl-carrier-protein] synthase family protein [Paenibacillus sp. ISL-20]